MSSKHHTSSSSKHHRSPDVKISKDRRKDSGSRRERSRSPRRRISGPIHRRTVPFRRFSPLRKPPDTRPKSTPVNELDLLSGEATLKSGNAMEKATFDAPVRRSREFRGRGRFISTGGMRTGFGSGARAGGIGFRQGKDFRRFAPVAQRRNGFRNDAAGSSGGLERGTHTQSWQHNKEEEEGKPVMNLFDPTKVPTGKSYFTHDDRSGRTPREKTFERKFSAPLGWRNAPREHVSKYRSQDRDAPKRSNSKPVEDVWKHDMFEEAGDGE